MLSNLHWTTTLSGCLWKLCATSILLDLPIPITSHSPLTLHEWKHFMRSCFVVQYIWFSCFVSMPPNLNSASHGVLLLTHEAAGIMQNAEALLRKDMNIRGYSLARHADRKTSRVRDTQSDQKLCTIWIRPVQPLCLMWMHAWCNFPLFQPLCGVQIWQTSIAVKSGNVTEKAAPKASHHALFLKEM